MILQNKTKPKKKKQKTNKKWQNLEKKKLKIDIFWVGILRLHPLNTANENHLNVVLSLLLVVIHIKLKSFFWYRCEKGRPRDFMHLFIYFQSDHKFFVMFRVLKFIRFISRAAQFLTKLTVHLSIHIHPSIPPSISFFLVFFHSKVIEFNKIHTYTYTYTYNSQKLRDS